MRLLLCSALLLTLGCDKADKAPEAAPSATPREAKPATAHGAPPATAHGAPPATAGLPAGHPTAGHPPMAKPSGLPPMAAAAPPPGPPRDITPSGDTRSSTLDELSWAVPSEWEDRAPSNAMRKATYVLPGPGGDVELVVFRFQGGAGSVEANLARWKGQMNLATEETTEKFEANGLSITVLSLGGTYSGAMQPGGEEKHDDPGARMIAAVAEGSGDALFFKVVGPKATVDLWAPALTASLGSLTPSTAAAEP